MKPDLASSLARLSDCFSLDDLNGLTSTAYAVDAEFSLVFVNHAWQEFAAANNAGSDFMKKWPLGANILDSMPHIIRNFYVDAYARSMATGERWDHDYECSSPEIYRKYHQTAYPLPAGGGLLIVNSLLVETPIGEEASSDPGGPISVYLDKNGILHQCSHCRRVRLPDNEGHWDWVPSLVAKPYDPTSHGLCPPCLDHYYSPLD